MSKLLDSARAPVVITAPNGTGKTSVLTNRRTEVGADRIVLLRLELRHNVPANLIADLRIAGARTAMGDTLDAALGFEEPPQDGGERITVALDCADVLQSSDSLDVIRRLVHPRVSLLVAARDARAPVCRVLRFEFYAVRIGPEQLAFSPPEAADLLAMHGLSASPADLSANVAECGGWAVALGLLAQSARHSGRLDRDTFDAARDEFRDFLIDQIVGGFDTQRLTLLSQIAITDGPIDVANLTHAGIPHVDARVEELGAAGLLVARDRPPGRLHPALVDALLWQMRVDDEFGHRMWAAAVDDRLVTGGHVDALRLARRSDRQDIVRSTLEQTWPACFIETQVVSDALNSLPLPVRHASPSLLLLEGVLGALRERDTARMLIATRMADDLGPATDQDTAVLLGYAHLVLALLIGEHSQAVRQAERLLDMLSSDAELNPDVTGMALRALGYYQLCAGELTLARRHFEAARALARFTGLPVVAAASSAGLAITAALAGHAVEVDDHLLDVRAVQAAGAFLPPSSWIAANVAEALIAVQRGDPAGAMIAIDRIDDMRVAENQLPMLAYAQALAFRWQGGGMLGVSAVDATISRCPDAALAPFQRQMLSAARSLALLGAGRWDDAELAARLTLPVGNHAICTPTLVALACLYRGSQVAALEAVAPCVTMDDHVPHTRALALFVSALAGFVNGDAGALQQFYRAVVLADRIGCIGDLVLVTPNLPGVLPLVAAARADTSDESILPVCDRLAWVSTHMRAGATPPALTERERQIAIRLGSDLPLARLADELFVSPNTVNTQVRRLYRKLGVSSRTDAVALLRLYGIPSG